MTIGINASKEIINIPVELHSHCQDFCLLVPGQTKIMFHHFAILLVSLKQDCNIYNTPQIQKPMSSSNTLLQNLLQMLQSTPDICLNLHKMSQSTSCLD